MTDPGELILEYLKQKGAVTDLEKDILLTVKVLQKDPFSNEEAQKKILVNDFKYPDIALAISQTPGTVSKLFKNCSDVDLKNALACQLQKMIAKEFLELKNRLWLQ